MKLAVVSHKRCWRDKTSPTGYSTYGGFPLQMKALSALFDETVLVLPVMKGSLPEGSGWLEGKNLRVQPIPSPYGAGVGRKIGVLAWLPRNASRIWRAIASSDAVHAPIPGDIGTIGMLFAVVQKKPLLVRHCGNWLHDASAMRKFLRWLMERYAGGTRVMLATGGAATPPSEKNREIRWIFSTSLTQTELDEFASERRLDSPSHARLIIVCRQDPGKNVDALIRAVAELIKTYPDLTLDVVGDGELMSYNKQVAEEAGVAGAVIFHGKLDHDGVMERLRNADLFVFPTNSEGFPKSVLEAMAHGLPVVSTGVSVLPELLGNGSGALLRNAAPESIVETVDAILDDTERYAQMSRNAAARAAEYSLERWGETLRKLMEEAWQQPLKTTN